MLKKRKKSNIITMIILICIFAALGAAAVDAEEEGMEFVVKPLYVYQNKGNRDPFEPRYRKESISVIADIDISSFMLVGITESNGVKAALFKSKSGNPFGYVFISGKLYGDNDREIPDVKGEIKSDTEVLLVQGDREVLFKLAEDVRGPNIKGEDK